MSIRGASVIGAGAALPGRLARFWRQARGWYAVSGKNVSTDRLAAFSSVLLLVALVATGARADGTYYDVAFSQAPGELYTRPLSGAAVTVRKNADCLGGVVACGDVAASTTTDAYGNWSVSLPESDYYDIAVAGGQTRANVFIATSAIGTSGAPANASFITATTEAQLSNESVLTEGAGITVSVAGGLATLSSTLGVDVDLASSEATGIAPLARGGTNKGTGWTAARCVRVNDTGTGFEPAAEDCQTIAVTGSGLKLDAPSGGDLESTSLTQITVTGDTNTIFSESADVLTVAVGTNWPTADKATELASDPTDCGTSPQQYAKGIAANGNLTCSQVSVSELSGVLPITSGGTGLGSGWSSAADQCIKVNALGNGLEPTGAACGSGSGSGAINVENNGTSVVAAATTLNFSSKFLVEPPGGNQADVTIANGGIVLGTDTTGTLPLSQGGLANANLGAPDANRCLALNAEGTQVVSADCATGVTFPKTECMMLDVGAGIPPTTGGCTKRTVIGANFDYEVCDFPDGSDTYLVWNFQLPLNLTGTTAQVRVVWTSDDPSCDNTSPRDVCWSVVSTSIATSTQWKAAALSGTPVGTTRRCEEAGRIYKVSPIELVHGFVVGRRAIVRVMRDDDGGLCGGSTWDDYVEPAGLLALQVCYQVRSIFSGGD